MADNNLSALIAGGEFGRGVRNDAMRMQQLRSQQALQRLQEQQAAETLRWTLMQHAQAVQQQADNAKATAEFMAMQSPTINIPNPLGGGAVPAPNPAYTPDVGQAYINAFLKTSRDPGKTLLDAATLQLRQSQAFDERAMAQTRGQPRPLAPQDIALKEAQTKLAETRADQLAKGQGYAPSEIEKKLKALADAETRNDHTAISALRRELKLDSLSETEGIKLRSELRALDSDQFMSIEEKSKRREEIYSRYAKGSSQTRDIIQERNSIRDAFRQGKISREEALEALRQTGLQ